MKVDLLSHKIYPFLRAGDTPPFPHVKEWKQFVFATEEIKLELHETYKLNAGRHDHGTMNNITESECK